MKSYTPAVVLVLLKFAHARPVGLSAANSKSDVRHQRPTIYYAMRKSRAPAVP